MSLLGTSKSIWGFDPRSVPGCQLWLDAADRLSMTVSGSSVTQWNDKSGNARNYTTLGTAPIYSSGDGGSVTFSNGQALANTSTWSGNGAGVDIFAVSTPWPFTQYNNWRTLFRGSNAGHRVIIEYNSSRLGYYGPAGFQQFGSLTLGQTKSLLYVTTNTSFVTSGALNGTVALSVAGSTQDSDAYPFYCLGAWQGGPSQPWGTINEVMVFSNITTTQRQAVEGYLARKWFTTTPLGATHPYYAIQPFLRRFVPTDLPNCSLWLDGADQSSTSMTLTSSRLTTWKDKSGYGNDFTAAPFATTAPTFSNIGPLLTGPYFAALQARRNTTMTFPKVYTIFCVANQQAAAPGAYAYIMHSPFNADFILFFGTFNATHNFATFNGSGSWNDVASNTPASAVAATPTTASLLCCTNNGSNTATSLVPYFNGVAMNAKNGTNAVAFGMIIGDTSANGTGGAGSGNQPWLGGIGEIIIYGSLLTTIQRQQVEGYLASKWGIQGNLAATHPYKTIPAATAAQTINLYDDFVYGPAVTPGYVYGNLHGWTISGGIGAAGGAFDASPANTYPYYMFIQGNTATGSKAIVPTPGYTATISFSFARRGAGVGGSTVSVTVYFGSTIIYGPTNTPAVGSGWSTVTFTYLMTSTHTSISFVCGVSPATDQSLIVTNVSII